MRDALRWIGYGLLVVIGLVAVVFAAYRLRGPTREQRAALAAMQTDYRPKTGTNAFPLLLFMPYDVPEGELAARMAAEITAASKRTSAEGMTLSFEPSAGKLAEADGDLVGLCEIRSTDCLTTVAAHPESTRAALAAHPVTLSREEAFERTDFYWNDFPAGSHAAIVAHPSVAQRVWLSSFALQFVDGDHRGGLAGVCRNLDTWRLLRRGTNSLLGSMIAISAVDGDIHLFAQMLAALPNEEGVPQACDRAMRPIEPADMDRCGELAGEFAWLGAQMRDGMSRAKPVSWMDRTLGWMTLDWHQSDAWRAEILAAPYCGEDAVRRMLANVPVRADEIRPVTRRMECVSSLTGCFLADIAAPAYVEYDRRTLDFAAHLRLAATLLWLRDPAIDGSRVVRFDNRPGQLRSGTRKSGFDPQAQTLFVENLDPRVPRFVLPISTNTR